MPTTGAPLGTPLSFGELAAYAEPARRPVSFVRLFDTLTRDWSIDTEARSFRRMPRNKQRVILSLLTIRGSNPAIPRMGMTRPAKIDTRTERRIQAAARDALRPMTEDGSITIRGIRAAVGGGANNGRVAVAVDYVDNETGEPDTAAAGI